jgi:hypothetical protein
MPDARQTSHFVFSKVQNIITKAEIAFSINFMDSPAPALLPAESLC